MEKWKSARATGLRKVHYGSCPPWHDLKRYVYVNVAQRVRDAATRLPQRTRGASGQQMKKSKERVSISKNDWPTLPVFHWLDLAVSFQSCARAAMPRRAARAYSASVYSVNAVHVCHTRWSYMIPFLFAAVVLLRWRGGRVGYRWWERRRNVAAGRRKNAL